MEMISSRNLTSHTYNEDTAEEIFIKLNEDYLPCFLELEEKFIELKIEEE